MANLVSMLNRFIGGRRGAAGTGRGTAAGTGTPMGGGGMGAPRARRGQDEAIGRGVRGLLSRFRR